MRRDPAIVERVRKIRGRLQASAKMSLMSKRISSNQCQWEGLRRSVCHTESSGMCGDVEACGEAELECAGSGKANLEVEHGLGPGLGQCVGNAAEGQQNWQGDSLMPTSQDDNQAHADEVALGKAEDLKFLVNLDDRKLYDVDKAARRIQQVWNARCLWKLRRKARVMFKMRAVRWTGALSAKKQSRDSPQEDGEESDDHAREVGGDDGLGTEEGVGSCLGYVTSGPASACPREAEHERGTVADSRPTAASCNDVVSYCSTPSFSDSDDSVQGIHALTTGCNTVLEDPAQSAELDIQANLARVERRLQRLFDAEDFDREVERDAEEA